MTPANYPTFVPPGELSITDRTVWTRSQADEYFDWLMRVKDDRVHRMLERLDATIVDADAELSLGTLGRKIASTLRTAEFCANSKLTNQGYALAADAGLLVAEFLVQDFAEVHWEIRRKPKRDISYNLPVLMGFQSGLSFDPVGGSVAEAQAWIAGRRDADRWVAIYRHWSQQV